MKKNIVFFLCVVMIFSACSMKDNNTIPGTVDVCNFDSTSTIKIPNDINKYPIGLYSNIFSNVDYVALEYTDKSIVSTITKMAITNNNDLLIFDFQNKAVLLFDSTGKFKNKIGVLGRAQNEYIEPLDMVYDEIHNQVIVYDNAKKTLMYYNTEGKYLKSISLNEYIESFEVLDDSHLVLYYDYKGSEDNNINYNFKIIDTKGNIIKELAPYDKSMIYVTMGPAPFHKFNGNLFCHIERTPVVNEITLKGMKPKYVFDLGTYQLPNDYYMHGYETFCEKVLSLEQNKATILKFYQTDKSVITTLACRGNSPEMFSKLMIIRDSVCSQPEYYITLINDLYGKQSLGPSELCHVFKNKAFFVCDPSFISSLSEFPSNTDVSSKIAKRYRDIAKKSANDMKTIYNNIADVFEQSTFSLTITDKEKGFIDSLKKVNNPIIQICTFKK